MSGRLVETRDGTRINVREVGQGPAVLFIHGWSLSGEVWDRQLGAVAAAGYRALAMDQRGHGDSDAPLQGYEIDGLVADAVDVLGAFGVDHAVVVGWSLGGMVGLRLAHDHPDLVDALVMVASNGVSASRTDAFAFGVPADKPLAAILGAEHADRIALRRSAVGDPFKGDPDPQTLDWLHRVSLQTPTWAAQAAMRTLMCTDQTHVLDDLSVPVTQIVGTADPALSVRGARWVRDRLASTLVELDCGHYPMLECPDEFDAALLGGIGRRREVPKAEESGAEASILRVRT
ncbi:putative hydrolase [Gordonia polyisoprenivorans NBRC 16320 = JCM 10675]|uniref:Alpha/beta hydrolase n=1 Tax=Gordonia polyisoprenivorans TaxID=84595 RepID=A0A846WI72_9ACTN|nr:alpha/beta hydrolase [Gordonia polyisoprenivorans]NKY01435.1 alpha/beta hydrolase [Gordonia polyisoprenivorans]GAB26314.1 putative hydrolase [Gordonia polyisoprenivorans NBRC 16320 = JCM 10675]